MSPIFSAGQNPIEGGEMSVSRTRDDEPPMLDSVRDIDAEWLSAVLQFAGHKDAHVSGFCGRPIGNGNVSDTVRVEVEYSQQTSAPRAIVCKFRSSDPAAHAHGISSGSYFREMASYRLVGQSCRTPHLLWLEGSDTNINLVIEDLTETARAGDQIAGCRPADARGVVVELAKLHRAFYPMTEQAAPCWAMTMAGAADYWVAAIGRALPVIRDSVAERLNVDELHLVEQVHRVSSQWYRFPVSRGTITHGDPRADNILFIDSNNGLDASAVLIDWQLTGWRNPMHDVGYFLSGSVSVDDRRKHERSLLQAYGETFGSAYTSEEILADYRVQLLSGLMTTIACYGLLPLTPEFDRLLITLLKRNLAAAADWESIPAVSVR